MNRERVELTIKKNATARIPGIVRGLLLGFNDEGVPLVDYPGNPVASAIPSQSTVALKEKDRGRDAALFFEGGDPAKPIIVGLIQPAIAEPPRPSDEQKLDLTIDGKRIEIEGQDEVVLRCGKASITLRHNGRLIIRGTYVESRSKGTNRIKGGSVQIN
jgi:hypothetical protein